MSDFEGITGDAGQFFEVVDAGKAVAEANELLTLFAQIAVALRHSSPHITKEKGLVQ